MVITGWCTRPHWAVEDVELGKLAPVLTDEEGVPVIVKPSINVPATATSISVTLKGGRLIGERRLRERSSLLLPVLIE
jgi:hypothetical protein